MKPTLIKLTTTFITIIALATITSTVASAALTIGATTITTDGNLDINGVATSAYTLGAATTTGTITIGGTAQAGNLILGQVTTTPVGIGTAPGTGIGLDVQPAITATSGSAVGTRFQQTLTAAANNDALTAVYINPTFTDGAYTGVNHNGLFLSISGGTGQNKAIYAGNNTVGAAGVDQEALYTDLDPANPLGDRFAGLFSYVSPTGMVSGAVAYGVYTNARNRFGNSAAYSVGGYFCAGCSVNKPATAATLNIANSVGLIANAGTADAVSGNASDIFYGKANGVTKFSILNNGNVASTGSYTSTLSTGTAPFVITSTTPVANLTLSNHPKVQACGTTTTCSATATTGAQVVFGTVTLSSSAATITGLSPAFTSTTSYYCTATEVTNAAGTLKVANVSGSSFTITETAGGATDVVNYICVGN